MASTITPAPTSTTPDRTPVGAHPLSDPAVIEVAGTRRPARAVAAVSLVLLVVAGASAAVLHHASTDTGTAAAGTSTAVVGASAVHTGRDGAVRALTPADLVDAGDAGRSPRRLDVARAAAASPSVDHVGTVGTGHGRALLES